MLPPRFGADTVRRLLIRLLPVLAAPALLAFAGGCGRQSIDVPVKQPIAFAHQRHLAYFASGQHRQEKIRMHVDMLGLTETPPELAQGRCVECHDDLASKTACAGCHTLYQDSALRDRKDIRPCAGCHRGAWAGSNATIPSTELCIACHGGEMQAIRQGRKPRPVSLASLDTTPPDPALSQEVPWVQINTMPPNVYFSHTAHVRYKAIACTRCHDDVRGLSAPPTSVRAMSMSECLRCHAENGASTDCLTCHK